MTAAQVLAWPRVSWGWGRDCRLDWSFQLETQRPPDASELALGMTLGDSGGIMGRVQAGKPLSLAGAEQLVLGRRECRLMHPWGRCRLPPGAQGSWRSIWISTIVKQTQVALRACPHTCMDGVRCHGAQQWLLRKEPQKRLGPSISRGGPSLRALCSYMCPNVCKQRADPCLSQRPGNPGIGALRTVPKPQLSPWPCLFLPCII